MGNYKKRQGIYMITNIIDKKVYIGHSKNISRRMDDHKHKLRRDFHTNDHLQNAWNLHGEKYFIFSIIEILDIPYSKVKFEEIETKWILHFNSHLKDYGYNKCLPGSYPLNDENSNSCNIGKNKDTRIICINRLTKETVSFPNYKEMSEKLNIPINKLSKYTGYWRGVKGSKYSYRGWILIKEVDYNTSIDYINFKKVRKPVVRKNYKYGKKLTSKEYGQLRRKKDKIPYENRKLKRIPIIAVNVQTDEEIEFDSIKSTSDRFCIGLVRKCLNNPFRQYKHRGYYFKKKVKE